jgi:nicotinate-nucleotide--dimethylbenzimidazole phosphoribosyltransferase
VNPFPQSVTRQMVENFLSGGAAINTFARVAGAELAIVDVGVAGDPIRHPKLISRRIGSGTANLCRFPAMSRKETESAVTLGMQCAADFLKRGMRMLAIGEMGIGNSTVASALCAAITGLQADKVCGRGTGCDDAGLVRKRDAVQRAMRLHQHEIADPWDLLSRLGGFEIAAMCGVCIQAAHSRCPVLIDGFISTAAAAVATRMHPAISDYLIASHQSVEPGHAALLNLLNLKPLLDLGMRLGEGTGAALAIPIVRAAVSGFTSMATFESAGVSEAHEKV